MSRLLFACLIFFAACESSKDLPVVEKVDLERYQGRWYEIASIPIRPQRNCKCTYAEYTLKENEVEVYNKCIDKRDGSVSDITGKAFPVEGTNNARLKVSFFPLIKSPYEIIALDENYQYALVGSPKRTTLWVLCRTTIMEEALYKKLVKKAKTLGFPVDQLLMTEHDC